MPGLLRRQLAESALTEDAPPDLAQWQALLARVERTYDEARHDRGMVERSMTTSSHEMQALHDELRLSDANFKLLVEGMSDAVFVHQDGVVRYANPAMAALLGAGGPAELIGKDPIEAFIHPDDRHAARDFGRRRASGETAGMLRIRWTRRDQEVVFVEGTSTEITHDGRPATAVVVRDISARLREQDRRRCVERSLQLSEERYRVLFEGSPMSIVLFDPRTLRILAVNGAAVTLYGYPRDEFLQLKLTDLKTHEDEELGRGMAQIAATGHRLWRGTKKHRRKDGTVIDVDVASHTVIVDDRPAVLALFADVTERMRLEGQLRHAQKMEAVGRLAGGIAHDFNNILAVIVADAEFLGEELGAAHGLHGVADEIVAAAQRGAALTGQMLTFSRQDPIAPCALSLNRRVDDLGKMLARIIGEDVHMHAELDPRLGSVLADPGQIDQVLLNLVVNARDAMPSGGTLSIETANVELTPGEAAALGLEPGPHVRLTVEDTGEGMTPAVRERVFEPFFTTKRVGKGTGLGLATVFGIVRGSGGAIGVQSEPGRGTTFQIHFPQAHAGTRVRSSVRPPAALPRRGSETILLVEDELPVRRAVSRLLASHGYEVLEVDSAASALETFDRLGAAVHLVLTDLVMPDMDGRTMAESMRSRRPGVRVLFMSGYSDHPALNGAAHRTADVIVRKPFTAEQMTSAVRGALSPAE